MKRILPSLLISNLFLLSCCTPLVITKLEQSIPQSSADESINVFGLYSEIPSDAEVLGTVKIGDTGFTFTKNCTFQDVLNTAKDEAKKAGGSIAIRKEGLNTLWAEIDKKAEIQINIEFGHTYYLKCDLLFGDERRQPLIKLVDPKEGSRYFNLFW